ncbi:hypothetical protein QF028_002605 [Neobacillus sp. B4I6]
MANLVKCKACGKEIAKGVKKCPHCGKDQRNWFMRHKIMTFIGAIILLAIIGSALSGGDDTAKDSNNKQGTKETVYKVGEVVKTDNLEITVTKSEEKDVIGDPEFLGKKASEGATLVAIQYKMKNISDKPVGAFDYPTINLIDEKGTKYDPDVDASAAYATETGIDNSKIMSDLNPGITVTGTDVYEISKDQFAKGKWFIQIGDDKVQIK